MESILFGHEKGAFTGAVDKHVGKFQEAHGGTLFLDEVGELPPDIQVKLLRALQERRIRPVGSNREIEVDFKLIAATNQDLRNAVSAGEFRDDLYFRLNVFTLKLPPLRERPEDIPAIARYYLGEYAQQYRASVDTVELLKRVESDFQDYRWPGNVRELRNAIETMVVLDRNGELGLEDLPPGLRGEQLGPLVGGQLHRGMGGRGLGHGTSGLRAGCTDGTAVAP